MNETSATSQSGASLLPEGIGALTTVHLALIVLVAIAAVAIIVIGARRKHVRKEAERQVEHRAEDAGVPPAATGPDPVVEPAAPTPAAAPPPAAEPVSPPGPAPLADEPIAAAAPLDASPASEAAPEPAGEPPFASADLGNGPVTQLKGLGPKVAAALAERGITTVGQLTRLSDAEAAALDAELGPFRGRMGRDRWIEQAHLLAAGDRAGFEAAFGKL